MNNEKVIAICIAVMVFCAGYLFGRLHHDSTGTDSIGNQLEQAQSTANTVTNGIGQAEQTAAAARDTTGTIQSIIVDTGDTIKDCQRILEGIRARGEK